MARALRLAARGMYSTQPNPRVGCVIAHGDEIVGEGWHCRAGEPHAEGYALRAAGERARGATAYVTLEPCAHHGRTPPCADALIAAGVARVVAACEDPNPKVAGGGFARARAAGIAVDVGLMREAARELNRGFLSRIERGAPWVRVKLAMSLDGRTALANGTSKWISGDAARADVQHWRARSSAILTGIGTVLADNPKLTVRLHPNVPPHDSVGEERRGEGAEVGSRNTRRLFTQLSPPSKQGEEGFTPLRVVLDSNLRTPAGTTLLDGSAPTLILHAADAAPQDDRFAHVELVAVSSDANGRLDLAALLRLLAVRGVNELQVEAGATLAGALFEQQLVDELLLYVAPVILGDQARPLLAAPRLDDMLQARRLRVVEQRQLGADLRLLLRE